MNGGVMVRANESQILQAILAAAADPLQMMPMTQALAIGVAWIPGANLAPSRVKVLQGEHKLAVSTRSLLIEVMGPFFGNSGSLFSDQGVDRVGRSKQ